MNKFKNINWSLISFFISIMALLISVIRCEPLEADWISILIGILSLLVTILIGWQIYTVLDIKRTINEIKSKSNIIQEETMARAYTSIMNQTSYVIEGRTEHDDCYNAIANCLFACKHYHYAKNEKAFSELIAMLSNVKKKNCRLTRRQINNLYVIIGQLKECDIDVSAIEKWMEEYE